MGHAHPPRDQWVVVPTCCAAQKPQTQRGLPGRRAALHKGRSAPRPPISHTYAGIKTFMQLFAHPLA